MMKTVVKLNINKQIVILSLEPIETRYTCQWHTYLPKYFSESLLGYEVIQIDGNITTTKTTAGAFLNFVGTNEWKSSQMFKFFEHVGSGKINDDAIIIITDFWNPCVNQIKYTKELMNKSWTVIGFAHAGMYDPYDFLGRDIKDRAWGKATEMALFESYDKVVFATDFHVNLFLSSYPNVNRAKILRSGLPFKILSEQIKPLEKEDIVLFPHRLAPEKRHDIFLKYKEALPQYKFITCQETPLTKDEYHSLLGRSKVVFSANQQETLGISTCGEALYADAIPFAPMTLSYNEILPDFCKYTTNHNLSLNISRLSDIMTAYNMYREILQKYKTNILNKYFDCQQLFRYIESI